MTEHTSLPLTSSRAEEIFPTLSQAQMQRLRGYGQARWVRLGEALVEPGENDVPLFVAISGELEAVRPSFGHETLIRTFGPGQFTGELTTLSGRRAIAGIRARQDGEVIEIAHESFLALVQVEAE